MCQRDAVGDQGAENPSERGKPQRIGMDRLDQRGRAILEIVHQSAHFLRAEQLIAVAQQFLIGVGSDDSAGIDCQKAFGNSVIARRRIDPQGRAVEAGIARCFARQPMARPYVARVDREQT